jgi:hypothetical protein
MTETEQELYPSQQHHSKAQIEIDRAVRQRVLKGIELLKREHGEDWWLKIDMNALELKSGTACVLGQLYHDAETDERNGYEVGAEALGIRFHERDYGFNVVGFEWNALNAAWRGEIEYLKEAAIA